MSSGFSELRSEAMQVEALDSSPAVTDTYEGRTYLDTTLGRLYVYVNGGWKFVAMTSTSTTTTSSSSTSTSTTSTSTSSTSSSTSTTSSSTSSTSTSTTLW